MNSLTRRRLLQGSAAACIASLGKTGFAKPAHAPVYQPSFKYLNVLVHGLSAIMVQAQNPTEGIQLLFPEITSKDPSFLHEYLFGNLAGPPDPTSGLLKLTNGHIFSLTGVKTGSRPTKDDFGTHSNVMVDSATPNGNAAFRTLLLPWTNKIGSLDLKQRDDASPMIDDSRANQVDNNSLKFLSTIHLFVYEVEASGPKVLIDRSTDAGWVPTPSSDPDYADLHVFAEPGKRSVPHHAIHAFNKLTDMLMTSDGNVGDFLTFRCFDTMVDVPPTFKPPGIQSIPDLEHLADLRPHDRVTVGGEVANCVGIVSFQ
jgi:hypothetical protein